MRNKLKEYPIGCISNDGRLHDPVTATIAVVAAGSLYSAREQSIAQKKAGDSQQMAQAQAQAQDMEARRIAASAKPMDETATLLTGASKGSVLGNLGLTVEPTSKKVATLGGTTSTGLGFGTA